MMKLIIIILLVSIVSSGDIHYHQCSTYGGRTYQLNVGANGVQLVQSITLHKDYTAHRIDSTQNGVGPTGTVEYPPYTALIGEWRCVGRNQVELRFINYDLRVANSSVPASVSETRYTWTFTKDHDHFGGTFQWTLYPIGTDPTRPGTTPSYGGTQGPYNIQSGNRLHFFP
ncbi:unnamed protein product [Rotaria sp. Silwood1]|nr:unnamed protein product [Rotaria sp. Silwood1]